MPFLLCCEESSPVVINNFLSFFYSRTFSNVRANQTQHDRSLGGKKNTAQRAEKKADLSCIFMLQEGSMTAVSENCEQWQKKVCLLRDS